jgi:hypothetical protein
MNLNKEPIFVIGYPKSGNTWVARICADTLDSPLVTGNDPVNQADKKQEYKGEFEIYKLHCSKQSKPDYITKSSKIFYVIRDFRDILISGYFFNHKYHDEKRVMLKSGKSFLNTMSKLYFKHQMRRMTKHWTSHELTVLRNFFKKRKNTCGNWSDHVGYWTNFPNVCVVKYEDLLKDAYSIMRQAFNRLGINYSDRCLIGAIESQSFKKRKQEFQSKKDEINIRFMRKGVSGDWQHFLDEKMIKRVKQIHGKTMNQLGYKI